MKEIWDFDQLDSELLKWISFFVQVKSDGRTNLFEL